MDTKQREQIERGIESCKRIIRQFTALQRTLEIAKVSEDINLMTQQLQALNGEAQKAKATVTNINEARRK